MAGVAAQVGGAVSYPGLPSHPQHALLQRLANPGYGHGGLLTLVRLPPVISFMFSARGRCIHKVLIMRGPCSSVGPLGCMQTLLSSPSPDPEQRPARNCKTWSSQRVAERFLERAQNKQGFGLKPYTL